MDEHLPWDTVVGHHQWPGDLFHWSDAFGRQTEVGLREETNYKQLV